MSSNQDLARKFIMERPGQFDIEARIAIEGFGAWLDARAAGETGAPLCDCDTECVGPDARADKLCRAEEGCLKTEAVPVLNGINAPLLADALDRIALAFVNGRSADYGMRIPAEPHRDGDLVCAAAARLIRHLTSAAPETKAIPTGMDTHESHEHPEAR